MKQTVQKPATQTAEHKSRADVDTIQSDFSPDREMITPQNIPYLQRTIGNQATLKLIQRQQIPVKKRTNKPVVQRAETGLRDSDMSADVVSTVHAYATDTANADKHPRELLAIIMNAINVKLGALDVYQTSIVENSAGGANGTFSFSTWVINVNSERAFDGKTKISELSEDKIAGVASTLYHESRHCEQWYRMARLIAGEHRAKVNSIIDSALGILIPGKAIFDVATIARDITKRMGIPMMVALSATLNPLEPGSGAESAEAQDWYDSIYGANSAYRNAVLGVVMDVVARDLEGAFTELADLIKLKGEATTEFDTQSTQQQIDEKMVAINTRLQAVYNTRDTIFQAELTRLSGISPRTAIQATMFTHVGNLINVIDQTRSLPLDETNVATVKTLVTQIGAEVYQAYHDLPEETDAHATGDATEAQYKAEGTPAPAGP